MVKNLGKAIQPEEKTTFTKSIMGIVIFLYLMGAVLGTALVVVAAIIDIRHGLSVDSSMFIAYAAYLGGPTATSIIFYAWKSKAENILKIGQTFATEQKLEAIDILSKMGGN